MTRRFRDSGVPDPEVDSAVLLSYLCARPPLELRLDTETEENRCLFVRRYWYGDPYAELNNTFHISEKLLMNRLYQMRIRLKKYLEGKGVSV